MNCGVSLDVLHYFVGALLLGFALAVDSSIRDVAKRDARLAAQRSPDGSRQIEQQCLTCEEQRDPLVIADVVTWFVHLGTVLVERQIMRIGRPAIL